MGERATIEVGPCRCGGYGVALDPEHEGRFGTCHLVHEPVAVLRLDTDPVRIRVERTRTGLWTATVFDNIGGALAEGAFTSPSRDEATQKAVDAATRLGRRTLTVEWDGAGKADAMTKCDDGGPAFPEPITDNGHRGNGHPGMSLLDHFAGLLAVAYRHVEPCWPPNVVASSAYADARAMLAERARGRDDA
jgi:hypothetical protein